MSKETNSSNPLDLSGKDGDDEGKKVATHTRPSSQIDTSLLSAHGINKGTTTISSPSKHVSTPKKSSHHRNVSWGDDVFRNSPKSNQSPNSNPLFQPDLADVKQPGAPASSTKSPPRGLGRPPMARFIDEPASLALEADSLLQELQAETALMRSLDERAPMRKRADTGTSILSNVTMEGLGHDFRPPQDAKAMLQRTSSGRTVISDSKVPQSVAPREVPTLDRPKSHRRQLTVEETLFGLTSALGQIKHESPEIETPKNDKREDSATNRMDIAARNLIPTTAVRRQKANRKLSDEQVPPTRSEASAHLELPVGDYKKTDILPEANVAPSDLEKGGDEDQGVNNKDEEIGNTSATNPNGIKNSKGKKKRNAFRHLPGGDAIAHEWETFSIFMKPRHTTMKKYIYYMLLYLMIPAFGVAAILFHPLKNPPTGYAPTDSDKASASWWVIFICIREPILLAIAKALEVFFIEFLALRTKVTLRLFGPVITLLIVQSKGWPFLLLHWGILNFVLLYGSGPFVKHWAFWQDWWGLMNEMNPAGTISSSQTFYDICAVCVSIGAIVPFKRLAVGIFLGRKTFANYSQQLAKVMNKMLQISEVAAHGNEVKQRHWRRLMKKSLDKPKAELMLTKIISDQDLIGLIASTNAEESGDDNMSHVDSRSYSTSAGQAGRVFDPEDIDPYTGGLSSSQKARIAELLGQWEEPGRGHTSLDSVPISAVLQFRRALATMDTDFPFGGDFGIADTREACIKSSQILYERLLLQEEPEDGLLSFDVIGVLAKSAKGGFDNEKAKELIRTFRPDRDGILTMIDFVRAIDKVYKEIRMLKATVQSSSKIDQALESIFSVIFYVIMATVILLQFGYDPLALFLSTSSLILAFSFMIGRASAQYFEGLLFILIQSPYGVGDRINVSNPESESSFGGAQGWIIANVTLYTTTVYLAGTNEMATIANWSLAKSRIINGTRSPKAIMTVTMRFGLDVPYRKLEIFKSAVEKFIKARPREWLAIIGFRANKIESDLGYIEYGIVLQHRESWANIGMLLDSKHTLHCFCLELVRKLDMRYKSPALPVDLRMDGGQPSLELKYEHEGSSRENASTSSSALVKDITLKPSEEESHDSLEDVAALFAGR